MGRKYLIYVSEINDYSEGFLYSKERNIIFILLSSSSFICISHFRGNGISMSFELFRCRVLYFQGIIVHRHLSSIKCLLLSAKIL